jgi:hypothetical protein
VFAEYLKSPERTLFWDDDLNKNKDPFEDMPDGFFAADWDLKVSPKTFFFAHGFTFFLTPSFSNLITVKDIACASGATAVS